MLLIFLDIETTGLDPDKHRILEIAYRIVESTTNHSIVSYLSTIQQPLEVWKQADPKSLQINGFTWEDSLKGKSEKVVGSEILNDLNRVKLGESEGVFICQNPSFDRAFFIQLINTDLQYHYKWPYHWLDLASMYWAIQLKNNPEFPNQIKEIDLSKNKIAGYYGIPEEDSPHRAMNGVDHLIACYQAIFNKNLGC
ncbi:MAG: 3'-5' exonuclease [Chlamydiales bacterium]